MSWCTTIGFRSHNTCCASAYQLLCGLRYYSSAAFVMFASELEESNAPNTTLSAMLMKVKGGEG